MCLQFGHLFAQGPTREAATRAMVVALRDVRVRGEIHTIIDYAADMLQVSWLMSAACLFCPHCNPRHSCFSASCNMLLSASSRPACQVFSAVHAEIAPLAASRCLIPEAAPGCQTLHALVGALLLQCPDFVENKITTAWLDQRIAANVKTEQPPWYLCVIGAAAVRAHEAFACKAAEYLGFLSKGQLPPADISLIFFQVCLCQASSASSYPAVTRLVCVCVASMVDRAG